MRDRRGKGDGDDGGFERPAGPAKPTIAPGKTTRTQGLFPTRPVQSKPLATPEDRPRASEHDRDVSAHDGAAATPSAGKWEADAGLEDALGVESQEEGAEVEPSERATLGHDAAVTGEPRTAEPSVAMPTTVPQVPVQHRSLDEWSAAQPARGTPPPRTTAPVQRQAQPAAGPTNASAKETSTPGTDVGASAGTPAAGAAPMKARPPIPFEAEIIAEATLAARNKDERGIQVSRIGWLLLRLDVQRRLQAHFRIRTNAKGDPLAEAIHGLGVDTKTLLLKVVNVPPERGMTFERGEPPSLQTVRGGPSLDQAGETKAAAGAAPTKGERLDTAGADTAHADTRGEAALAAAETAASSAVAGESPTVGAEPVQLRATEAAEPDAVHAAAAQGVATPAQPLPHQGPIEASFGMDLSHVKAHVGGDAAASAQAMGAEAYATGDHVVLPASPSLETTAHEVAHVVQQSAGVQLKGGVGEVGDAYERQADEVASRVVRGKSAADLLPGASPTAGTSAVQRSPARDDQLADSTPITAAQYWARHGGLTGIQVGLRLPAEATILLDVAGLTLPETRRADFLRPLTRVLRGNPSWEEMELYLAEPLTSVIDGVRVVDERGYGPAKPERAVADRLVERFTFAIRASTHRLAPRYAQEKARLLASHEPRDGDTHPEPNPSALAPTRPLDGALAAGFCSGAVVFDLQAFHGRPPATIAGLGPPVPVELALERGRGDWMMVRVVSPPAATPQDVANELFGSPDRVHLMAGASGRYAFRFPPGGDLAPRWQAAWEQHIADDDLPLAHVLSLRVNPPDPAVAFTDASNQEGATARVIGPAPPPRGNEGTVQRLGMLDDLLTSMATSAVAFGMADALGPIQERIRARRHNCTLDAGEAARWAGHTDEQLAVVGEAADGLAAMAQQVKAMGLGQSTAKGEQLPDADVSALLQGPVREVASSFLRAAAAAELLDVARERLASAQARLAVYPVDMVDRLLVAIRARLAVMAPRPFAHRTFDQGRVQAIEARIQNEVSRLRQAIANGAPEVQFALAAIQQQVLLLDFVSSVGSTMSALEALKDDLTNAASWHNDWRRSQSIRTRLETALAPWQTLAQLYQDTVTAGKEATPEWVAFFRAQLDSLRDSTGLPQLLDEVKQYARDEAVRQKWISIGVIIGAIVATAATGGIAGGIAPGIGGAAIAAGVEAFTFTALSYGTLAQDVTFGGFVAQLGINFATFGGFKGIHYAGKAAAAAHGASIGLTLTEITAEGLWAAASAEANQAIMARVAAGEPMTQQSAAAIFGENLLIAAATRLAARAGGLFLAHIKGSSSLPEVQVAEAERAQVRLLADQVLATKDAQLGEAMLAADTRALGAERKALDRVHHLATHPAEAKQLGLEIDPAAAPQLQEMSAERAFAEAEREVAELSSKVTQFGDQALAGPDVFDPLLAAHRRMGSEVAKATDELGGIRATIRPRSADGTFAEPLTVHLQSSDSPSIRAPGTWRGTERPPPTKQSETGEPKISDGREAEAGAFVGVHGVHGAARQTAEQFDSAVSRHGGPAEALPTQAVDEIMADLPEAGIDAANPLPGIRSYLSLELRLDAGALVVEPLGGGWSGAQVFRVRRDGKVIGIFKIFRSRNELLREVSSLRRLADLELPTLEPVGITTLGRHGDTGVAFMREAEGDFVARTVHGVAEASGDARKAALAQLKRDVERVARGMAELHDATTSGSLVTNAMKQSEVERLQERWSFISGQTAGNGGPLAIPRSYADQIEARLDRIFDDFQDAKVPATMAHGDAHPGNFSVAPDGHVDTIDVETMTRSVDSSGLGVVPQATDAGRFSEWLMTEGIERGLTLAESSQVQHAFLDAYRVASRTAASSGGAFETALRFYQINFDTVVLKREIAQYGAGFDPKTSPALHGLLRNLGVSL